MISDLLTCYKYRTGAAAVRCLSEGLVYFAPPGELNDSLEARFDVADSKQFSAVIERTLTELSLHRGGLPYKLDGNADWGLFKSVNKRETDRFVAACQQVGIYSAASRPDNQPMWAYYCDNEKGVCLHLEFPKRLIEQYQLYPAQVNYSRNTRLLNRADDVRDELLDLATQNPSWNLEQLKAFSLTETFRRRLGIRGVARAVSIKRADWEHEGEVRILAPRSGILPLMGEILKSVIFTRTDFPEWGSIMMLLYKLYPNVRVMQMSFSHKEPFVVSQLMTTKTVPVETGYDLWMKPSQGEG